jgi:glycerol-3-phosphate cytidylyltransferase-like family protein
MIRLALPSFYSLSSVLATLPSAGSKAATSVSLVPTVKSLFEMEEQKDMVQSCAWVHEVAVDDGAATRAPSLPTPYDARAKLAVTAARNAMQGKPLFDVEAKVKPLPIDYSERSIPVNCFSAIYSMKAAHPPPPRDAPASTVYLSGSFDVLTPGDIGVLKEAAALGSRLVVGIVDDAEVCKMFSTNSRLIAGLRPFQPFLTAVPSDNPFPIHSTIERALTVLSIGCVDEVVMNVPVVPNAALLKNFGCDVYAQDVRSTEKLFTFPKLQSWTGGTIAEVGSYDAVSSCSEWQILERIEYV